MPSTASDRLKFEIQAAGENSGTWGDTKLNNALKCLEEGISGVVSVAVEGSDVTLTSVNYTPGAAEYRNAVVRLTAGTGVGTRNIIVPAVEKVYIIHNLTGFDQVIKTSGGTGADISALQPITIAFCDGTDCFSDSDTSDLDSVTLAGLGVSTYMQSVLDDATASDAQTTLGGTTVGKALFTAASESAGRTAIGLGTIATQASSSVTITGGSVTGITDLTVADGGTGASTAAGARTNLGIGLAGGTTTSLSGTATTVTSIPSGVKRVWIVLHALSTGGTNIPRLTIGDSGGLETSSYNAGVMQFNTTTNYYEGGTDYFPIAASSHTASLIQTSTISLTLCGTNTWAFALVQHGEDGDYAGFGSGSKALSGTLDRVSISAGGDSFDGGTITVYWES